MKKVTLHGRSVVKGLAEGKAIVIKKPFTFAHGVNPKTGVMIDQRQTPELVGEKVKDKVLVYPYGRGSTTGASWIIETVRCGNSPAAIINLETEPIIVGGAIQAELFYGKTLPIMDRLNQNPLDVIKSGYHVKVDANRGIVEVIRRRK
jgi:predicted aconitase with swiveling domain